jgi:hypothetical protein
MSPGIYTIDLRAETMILATGTGSNAIHSVASLPILLERANLGHSPIVPSKDVMIENNEGNRLSHLQRA